jgi:hypothetical protein
LIRFSRETRKKYIVPNCQNTILSKNNKVKKQPFKITQVAIMKISISSSLNFKSIDLIQNSLLTDKSFFKKSIQRFSQNHGLSGIKQNVML